MKAYGRAPQHPKGWSPGMRIPKGVRMWWESEGAQPEKGRERSEGRKEIIDQLEAMRGFDDCDGCPLCDASFWEDEETSPMAHQPTSGDGMIEPKGPCGD